MMGPFRERTYLGSRDLSHLDHMLSLFDAQHVAGVHRQYGVVSGLELVSADEGLHLRVEGGTAYSACGQLVCIPHAKLLAPPPFPGEYTIWLRIDERLQIRAAGGGGGGEAILLGQAGTRHNGIRTVWEEPTQARPQVPSPNQPHVASGTVTDMPIASTDLTEMRLSAVVDTRSGEFDDTPFYSATVGSDAHVVIFVFGLGFVSIPLGNYYTTISAPRQDEFTLNVHLQAVPLLPSLPHHLSFLNLDVNWIGVLPRGRDTRT